MVAGVRFSSVDVVVLLRPFEGPLFSSPLLGGVAFQLSFWVMLLLFSLKQHLPKEGGAKAPLSNRRVERKSTTGRTGREEETQHHAKEKAKQHHTTRERRKSSTFKGEEGNATPPRMRKEALPKMRRRHHHIN